MRRSLQQYLKIRTRERKQQESDTLSKSSSTVPWLLWAFGNAAILFLVDLTFTGAGSLVVGEGRVPLLLLLTFFRRTLGNIRTLSYLLIHQKLHVPFRRGPIVVSMSFATRAHVQLSSPMTRHLVDSNPTEVSQTLRKTCVGLPTKVCLSLGLICVCRK
jgi:hypothetical protein